jgi:hypothetical protein
MPGVESRCTGAESSALSGSTQPHGKGGGEGNRTSREETIL